ncbi:hypothetical protein [Candidatus Methylobacter oryzae]|uniref:Uncharacterized protein n=1 Tax=Candidatus Methylobacter oryzae TaxID=2497749 RepID=A0ABY3C893_9GAMM|nr:hypothetical protein [Candidatus Methylobacter oryzae]TRW91380.1 hypothetical protein EKO24_016680 [Candidatus Methylobacter oryzae]
MKYLLAALLLSISPVIMADLTYMSQQMTEMREFHQQQMLKWQQQQQEATRNYLQQQQEPKRRVQRERQPKQESFTNPLEMINTKDRTR